MNKNYSFSFSYAFYSDDITVFHFLRPFIFLHFITSRVKSRRSKCSAKTFINLNDINYSMSLIRLNKIMVNVTFHYVKNSICLFISVMNMNSFKMITVIKIEVIFNAHFTRRSLHFQTFHSIWIILYDSYNMIHIRFAGPI